MHRNKLWSVMNHHRPLMMLLLSWSAGLLTGTLFAVGLDPTFYSGMRECDYNIVSIPGSLAAVLCPFLLLAYAAAVSSLKLVLFFSFVKAFSLAFVSAWIYMAFGSAGWLIRYLLQFANVLSAPAFFWFCLRHLRGGITKSYCKDIIGCSLYMALIVLIDYCVIAPIWQQIADH